MLLVCVIGSVLALFFIATIHFKIPLPLLTRLQKSAIITGEVTALERESGYLLKVSVTQPLDIPSELKQLPGMLKVEGSQSMFVYMRPNEKRLPKVGHIARFKTMRRYYRVEAESLDRVTNWWYHDPTRPAPLEAQVPEPKMKTI